MSLAQTNFDRAVHSAHDTLMTLATIASSIRGRSAGPSHLDLHARTTTELRTIAWDLEAIQAAVRMELNNRLAGPDSMDMS